MPVVNVDTLNVKHMAHLMSKLYCSDDKQLFCRRDLQSTKPCEFNEVLLINLDRFIRSLRLNLCVDQMYLAGTVRVQNMLRSKPTFFSLPS